MNNPIVVPMTVSVDSAVFPMSLHSNVQTFNMSVDSHIEYAKIPTYYGLITYNGSVITVS